MIRIAPWDVTGGGKTFKVRPLTVRERIVLGEELAETKAAQAIRDARAAGAGFKDAVQIGQEARTAALAASALVMDAFTLGGCARILAACCDDAEGLLSALEPTEASMVALAALGVDVDRHRETLASAGDAVPQAAR